MYNHTSPNFGITGINEKNKKTFRSHEPCTLTSSHIVRILASQTDAEEPSAMVFSLTDKQ